MWFFSSLPLNSLLFLFLKLVRVDFCHLQLDKSEGYSEAQARFFLSLILWTLFRSFPSSFMHQSSNAIPVVLKFYPPCEAGFIFKLWKSLFSQGIDHKPKNPKVKLKTTTTTKAWLWGESLIVRSYGKGFVKHHLLNLTHKERVPRNHQKGVSCPT